METNQRVYLRALEPDDYKTSIKWRKDDAIWDMLGGPKYYVSEAYEKKWVEDVVFSSKDLKLAICLCEDDRYIGNVYMTDIDLVNRKCVSHIMIGEKDCWGKGYASEALSMAIDFMVNERGVQRIEALVLEENEPSLRLFEKCGYEFEGVKRKAVYKNGNFHNQCILAFIKE